MTPTITTAGIYDVPFKDYTSQKGLTPTPWLSSSVIKTMLQKSPRHAAFDHPDIGGGAEEESSKVANIGTVAHSLILHEHDERIVISPYPEFRSNEAKAWRDNNIDAGRVIVKQPEYDAAKAMATAFHKGIRVYEKELGEEFKTDQTEKTVVAEIEGVWCKIRVDAICSSLWDIKSTGVEMTPSKWVKNQLYGNGYDVQVEFYRRVFKAATGEDKRMILGVIEQNAPHDCYPVVLSNAADALAAAKVDWALKTWREGIESRIWMGYTPRVIYAEPPVWELSDWEQRRVLENAAQEMAA